MSCCIRTEMSKTWGVTLHNTWDCYHHEYTMSKQFLKFLVLLIYNLCLSYSLHAAWHTCRCLMRSVEGRRLRNTQPVTQDCRSRSWWHRHWKIDQYFFTHDLHLSHVLASLKDTLLSPWIWNVYYGAQSHTWWVYWQTHDGYYQSLIKCKIQESIVECFKKAVT